MVNSKNNTANRAENTELPIRHGFLLTRQWFETGSAQAKNLQFTFWLATEDGPLKVVVDRQEAIFFIAEKNKNAALTALQQFLPSRVQRFRDEDLSLQDFHGDRVFGVYFRSQRDLYVARDKLKEQGIETFEADIQPADRFLMERFLSGGVAAYGAVQRKNGYLEVYNPQLKPCEYTPRLKVMSLDIETSMSGDTLYSVGATVHLHEELATSSRGKPTNSGGHCVAKKVFLLRSPAYQHEEQAQQECDFIHYCEDQKSLMLAFLSWFHQVDPDCIIGWSVINFDLRFLQKKADELKITFALGRGATPLDWRTSRVNEDFLILVVPGRVVLDGIDTLKSATYTFESFALDAVAKTLLDRGKLIDDVDNRGAEITELFRTDHIALAKYNLEDCILVWDIFTHTQLLYFAIERARLTGLPMDRHGGSVAAFDFNYLPRLHRKGRVAPSLQDDPQGVGSPGGYVMDSKPGLYRNVFVLDFKSLYPSIIRTFHIDPFARVAGQELAVEVKREEKKQAAVKHSATRLNDDDQTVETAKIFPAETQEVDRAVAIPGFNGAIFAKRGAILPNIIGQLWKERDKAKRQKNQAMSQAVKILMNSFYGVLGTPGCRFFDYRLPSSITLRGHSILKQTKRLIEQKGFEVIYGDTDSVFVWFKDEEVSEEPAKILQKGQSLASELNQWWREFLHKYYDIPSFLELEFETCFSRFVMPTIRGSELGSKKRYAGLTLSANGSESKLVFKGLEAVRTDWTQLAREFQRELYRRVFYDEPIEEYVKEVVQQVYAGAFDAKLVYRKRIRRRLAEYQKNVPPHVQAARKADEYLQRQGRAAKYARGGWIRYILTTSGPEPMEYITADLDYDIYVERQIKPIVDGIAQFIGSSYASLMDKQMGLF
ncbi:DNA polymerase II [Thalassocella blandensis]|nr:DNA polymerase II [Thalassocella blandensis]